LFNKNLIEAAHLVNDLSYQGLEVWAEHLWRDDRGDLAEELTRFPFKIYLHGPIADLNLTSRNEKIASISLEENLKAIHLAQRLGAELVVIHPGRLSSSKDNPQDYWERQVQAIKRLASEAESKDVRVAIENMDNSPYEFINKPEDLDRLIKEVNSDKVGICLDLAHANSLRDGMADEFIERTGDNIIHLHISNSSKDVIHLPLNEGRSNCTEIVRIFLTKYRGGITIEGRDPQNEVQVVKSDRKAIESLLRR
jgi:sugar phosphate isomerase/epimerase